MAGLTNSILETIKKLLGISIEDTAFDVDLIYNINAVFMTLNQLGVGPAETFNIIDNAATWSDFLGEDVSTYSAVMSYIHMKVKLMFDPPASSFVLESMDNQITELEWRLRTQNEIETYVPPVPVDPDV